MSSQELRQVLNRGPFSKHLIAITNDKNALWNVLRITDPDPRLRDVELLLRLIAWRRFSRDYKGNMKPFLDDAMNRLNRTWDKERTKTETLTSQILLGIEASTKIFGEDAGRKFKGGTFERSLNRALFEVQAYYLSFSDARSVALKNAKKVKGMFRRLSDDADFLASIESTTKSIENYRTRFEKFRTMMEESLALKLEPLHLGNPK